MRRSSILMALCVMGISITSCKKENDVQKDKAAEVSSASIQEYSCVYTIKASQSVVDGSTLNLPAGSVVCLEAGTRGPLLLKNFTGQAGRPITFVNSNGKVSVNASSSNGYGIKLQNCKYVKLAGNGSNDEYGIHVNGSHIGVSFEALSTNWEMSNVEISNIGFAGLMGKTDPSCDPATWNGNFTMRDVSVHDNYVHDVTGEGLYIGNSFYAGGRSLSCGSIRPHNIEGLLVFKNKIYNSGCEGIQVGCATSGCEIFDNSIENFGKSPFAANQNNGLQLGEGTGGKCYNNIIKNGPGNGIICLGYGDNVVYNNLILNAGAYGVYCDTRYTPGKAFSFINNTVVNSGSDGFMIAASAIPMNNVINNIIVNPKSGKFVSSKSGVKLTASNNYTTMNIADVKFVNATANDYRLAAGSPAIDKGIDVSTFGVTYDYSKTARPTGGAYDAGAFEGTSAGTPVDPNPGTGTGGGTTNPGGGTTNPGGGTTNPGGGTTDPDPTPGTTNVTSVTLVNADTDKDIVTLTNGAVIDYSKLGTKNINVRANTVSGFAGSVQFKLDGAAITTESYAPLTMFGDAGSDYKPGTFAAGNHKLSVTDYSKAGAQGTAGLTTDISFTVTNGETTPPTNPNPGTGTGNETATGNTVTSLTLIDASTNREVATISNGATVSLSALGVSKVNIKANTGTGVKSVAFKLDGKSVRTESEAPYALGGDSNGKYNAITIAAGNHTVSATPYTSAGGKGTAGSALSVSFNLTR